MHSAAWIRLLGRIPPDQQDTLVVVTTIGIEINVQSILRTEDDYVVLRGRLAGTQETGRVFFVPYDQVNYVGFQREVKDAQIRALYGEAPPPEPVQPKAEAPPAPSAAAPDPPPAATPAPQP